MVWWGIVVLALLVSWAWVLAWPVDERQAVVDVCLEQAQDGGIYGQEQDTYVRDCVQLQR